MPITTVFAATGSLQTWTCPPGVTSVYVECWGAGGAGGTNSLTASGGGGGGGAYAAATVTVVPGTDYAVSVPSAANGDGGGAYFNTANAVYAFGGKAGSDGFPGNGDTGGAGGSVGSSVGTTKFPGGKGGGTGFAGGPQIYGGGGGASGSSSGPGSKGGGNGLGGQGLGGTNQGGGSGGRGGYGGILYAYSANPTGSPGNSPGGGGGGGLVGVGGMGAPGQVCVTYRLPLVPSTPPTPKILLVGTTTWTAPSCVTRVYVECWGGGAGGAGLQPTTADQGGGGGAYASAYVTVVPSTVYNVQVGYGGSGQGAPLGSQITWFKDASTVLAVGGLNDNFAGGGGGNPADCIGTIIFRGGNGGGGYVGTTGCGSGGGGAGASSQGPGADGTGGGVGFAGNGGVNPAARSDGGNGGSGGIDSTAASAGTFPGGGGGGGQANAYGADGGNGMIRLSYTQCSTLPAAVPVVNPNTDISETIGTGDFLLGGLLLQMDGWGQDVANVNYTIYAVNCQGVATGQSESGTGRYLASGPTLQRQIVASNSLDTTDKIDFAAGCKFVSLSKQTVYSGPGVVPAAQLYAPPGVLALVQNPIPADWGGAEVFETFPDNRFPSVESLQQYQGLNRFGRGEANAVLPPNFTPSPSPFNIIVNNTITCISSVVFWTSKLTNQLPGANFWTNSNTWAQIGTPVAQLNVSQLPSNVIYDVFLFYPTLNSNAPPQMVTVPWASNTARGTPLLTIQGVQCIQYIYGSASIPIAYVGSIFVDSSQLSGSNVVCMYPGNRGIYNLPNGQAQGDDLWAVVPQPATGSAVPLPTPFSWQQAGTYADAWQPMNSDTPGYAFFNPSIWQGFYLFGLPTLVNLRMQVAADQGGSIGIGKNSTSAVDPTFCLATSVVGVGNRQSMVAGASGQMLGIYTYNCLQARLGSIAAVPTFYSNASIGSNNLLFDQAGWFVSWVGA